MSRDALRPDSFYHIFHRGNNRENVFIEERNYSYFLKLYVHHVAPVADTYAYCLMRNHFHLLIRAKDEGDLRASVPMTEMTGFFEKPVISEYPSRAFAALFTACAKAINKAYGRTGSLFEERFKRILVDSDDYFTNLIFYIHFNPQKHGFVDDFREWKWSSYSAMLKDGPTKTKRADVLDRFGGRERLEQFHRGAVDEKLIAPLIADDFD